MQGLTVAELIRILQKQPLHLLVVRDLYSEQCLLQESDIKTISACDPRPDGWVHHARPDELEQKYIKIG